MLYDMLKRCVSIFFNLLNIILGGKLPPLGSACVIVEENDNYLVVELPGNRIVFPGGFMTWRETPQQAAEREGREETGLELQATALINFYSCASSAWTNMSTISFAFEAHITGGELRTNIEGRPLWLSEQELRTRFSPHSLRILEDYLLQRELRRRAVVERERTRVLLPAAS